MNKEATSEELKRLYKEAFKRGCSARAILQLTQAFKSPILDGEEFNAVNEGAHKEATINAQ
jgi:hypothetical protein